MHPPADQNAIADALGVTLDTVQRDMDQLTDVGKLPDRRRGKDGKDCRPSAPCGACDHCADQGEAPAPQPQPDILDEVEQLLARFVAFPTEHAGVAVTLWAAHAHAVAAFDSTPRLALLSPEPGSGKTRALEVLELLTPAPMHVLSASPAAIFRSIDDDPRPTLLFDEVDAIFGRHGKSDDHEDLRGLLNAGHRNGATIPRCVGPQHQVARFPVYAAAALAGLGDLPDTLMTRSVIVRMRRRRPGERVEPFRHRVHAPQGHDLRERLAGWVNSVVDQLTDAWPTMPDGIEDRPADVWEPLLAVADAAGGEWPTRARAACVALAGQAVSREASLGIRLLSDLRTIFGTADKLSTTAILDRLHGIEEAPWADLRGKALDARGLAYRLSQYEVHSSKVRIGDKVLQGYRAEDLHDSWTRYVSLPPGEVEHPEHPEHPRSEHPKPVPAPDHVPEHPSADVPEQLAMPEHNSPPSTRHVLDVPDVPDLRGDETDPTAAEHAESLDDLVRRN